MCTGAVFLFLNPFLLSSPPPCTPIPCRPSHTSVPPPPLLPPVACITHVISRLALRAATQVSFFGLHQAKGTPIWGDQGIYNDDTFWEQIDGGRPWTPARKVLLIVPLVLYVPPARLVAQCIGRGWGGGGGHIRAGVGGSRGGGGLGLYVPVVARSCAGAAACLPQPPPRRRTLHVPLGLAVGVFKHHRSFYPVALARSLTRLFPYTCVPYPATPPPRTHRYFLPTPALASQATTCGNTLASWP